MTEKTAAPSVPLALFVFAIFYGGMVCIAGVLGNKQVSLGPLAVEAGIFAFLLLVILSSAIAELYDQRTANRLVQFGFLPLIASMLLSWAVWALPPSPDMQSEYRDAIQLILGTTWRIWAAGIVAYGVSQTLNVTIFSALKRPGGSWLWLRSAVAGILSQIVDTLLFVLIAFWGVFPIGQLLIGQMLAKVLLSALLVPPLVILCVRLGHRLDASH